MKKGDYIQTPRFGLVKIEEVFENKESAWENGYKEFTGRNNYEEGFQ